MTRTSGSSRRFLFPLRRYRLDSSIRSPPHSAYRFSHFRSVDGMGLRNVSNFLSQRPLPGCRAASSSRIWPKFVVAAALIEASDRVAFLNLGAEERRVGKEWGNPCGA